MSIITILGSGLMGTAVAWPLADNGHEVRLVGTHLDAEIIRSCMDRGYHPRLRRQLPGRVTPFYVEDLPKALEGADLIVSGVNSLGVHWIGRTLGPLLWPGATVIAVTKGMEAFAATVTRSSCPTCCGRSHHGSGSGDIGGHRRAVHRGRTGRPAAFVRRLHLSECRGA